MVKSKKINVGISIGDPNGIGIEVMLKALSDSPSNDDCNYGCFVRFVQESLRSNSAISLCFINPYNDCISDVNFFCAIHYGYPNSVSYTHLTLPTKA